MKTIVQRSDLLRELLFVRPAFSSDPHTLRLIAGPQRLTMKATSRLAALESTIAAECESQGTFDIKGAPLLAIAKSLVDGALSLEVIEGALIVTQGGFEAKLYQALMFTDMKLEEYDFEVSLPATTFTSILSSVAHAVATEDSQHLKACALVEFRPEHLRAVGTDGRRLTSATMPGTGEVTRDLFIPTAVLEMVKEMLDAAGESDVTIQASGMTQLALQTGDRVMVTGLVMAKYPPYGNFIQPNGQNSKFSADRDKLIAAIKRTLLVSVKTQRQVSLVIEDDQLTVEVDASESGMRASEAVTIDRAESDPKRFRVNGLFLLDALESAPPGDLEFFFGNDRVPILITPVEQGITEIASVVMPLAEKK